MDEQNLDIYGHEPIPWSRALKQLEAQAREEGSGQTCWLATAGSDGRPHLAAVGALWLDDQFYFTSGPRTRKAKTSAPIRTARFRCRWTTSMLSSKALLAR
jgi:hypothetical protein